MKKIFWLMAYFLSPIILIIFLYISNSARYASEDLLFAMVIGALAYHWLLWQLIFSSRPQGLDQIFGLDKIYTFHGSMAIVSVILVFIHKLIFEETFGETRMTKIGSLAFAIYLFVLLTSLIVLKKNKWIKYKRLKKLAKTCEKFIRYESFKAYHLLSIVGVTFMQVHVLMTNSAREHVIIFLLYMIYFSIAINLYLYYKLIRPIKLKEDLWKVASIDQLNQDILQVTLVKNQESLYDNNYIQPGQFAFFGFQVEGKWNEHPFSIVSNEDNQLQIVVKALGDFTKSLKDLKKDTSVIVYGPFGRFSYLNYIEEEKRVFVAGGIGITPIISMLKHMKIANPSFKAHLIWGVAREEDLIFMDSLNDIMTYMPHLKVDIIVSDDSNYKGDKGFIDRIYLKDHLDPNWLVSISTGYYICGPEILMTNTITNLLNLGVNKGQIHYESFSY